MKKLTPNTPVEDIFMVGPAYAKRLKKLNIFTAEDFLHHYPSRYKDFSKITTINRIRPEEIVTIQGTILACNNIYTKRGKKIQKAVIQDKTGEIEVIWFNQPFIIHSLKPKLQISLSGKTQFFNSKLSLFSPEYEILKPHQKPIHTSAIIPVYPETAGLSSKWLRSRLNLLLKHLLPKLPDYLPTNIKSANKLINLKTALQHIHFPDTFLQLDPAKNRLAFDELFLLQLETLLKKQQWQKKKLTHKLNIDQNKILKLISNLPFKLTSAQNKSIKEILADLSTDKPMNRLLQGDVGSGKTVVAAVAIYTAYLNGFQTALMAPTEILANQHLATLKTVFSNTPIKIELITSSTRKLNTKYKIQNTDILIGTHALLFRKLNMQKLGLVIIDEQHRFGVQQRSKLIDLSKTPHLLTMTATPIPRTIALTLYGDLNISFIDKMPIGRKPIKTWVVPPEKRLSAYHWISKQIKKHKTQTFIIYPLIDQSDKETMKDIKAATAEFAKLTQIFSDLKLDLLHGRMKSVAKNKAINSFKKGETNILISTSVIEVGIDIPNATIMLIEDADRFGLAQLHQLRGRVGRGDKSSFCLLFSQSSKPAIISRLKSLEKSQSGLELAETDLKLRGPGEVFGVKQHGFFQLKIASFADKKLIQSTNKTAKIIIKQKKLSNYPLLKKKLKQSKISHIAPN